MSGISILIASLNDPDISNTIASIYATTGGRAEVVVVDDNSKVPVTNPPNCYAKIMRNKFRMGCGASRHIAAIHATQEYLLIVDSHMRFVPGWYDAAIERIKDRPKTLHCAAMVGIDASNMDLNNPQALYYGGMLNVFGKDRNNAFRNQILEAVWADEQAGDDYEIPCVLGACYFIPREWFLHIGGLQGIRAWGSDEELLSIKTWLAGGEVRLAKTIRIAHKFRLKTEKVPFSTPHQFRVYNKLFCIHTLLPRDLATKLISKFPKGAVFSRACEMIQNDLGVISNIQAENQRLFERDFYWLAKKFSLPLPA